MVRAINNRLGNIYISKEVIAAIAGHAVAECYGLVDMVSRTSPLLFRREGQHKGIEIKLDEKGMDIEVHVVVGYGTKISEVAQNVIEVVRYNVQKLTGLTVKEVKIIIEGIKVKG